MWVNRAFLLVLRKKVGGYDQCVTVLFLGVIRGVSSRYRALNLNGSDHCFESGKDFQMTQTRPG